MIPLTGSGRLVTRINAIAAAAQVNLANRTAGSLTSHTPRGTFIRVAPARRVIVAPQKQSDTWY
jgi:hypothetical protein